MAYRWLLTFLLVAALGFAASGSAAPPGATDLKVTKTAAAGSVSVGSTLTYTIEVENLGPLTATGVVVTDALPNGVDFASATSTVGQCSKQGQKVLCTVGSLESGPTAKVNSATVTLNVIARKAGTIENTASVKGDQQDPVSSNDQASVSVRVLGAKPGAKASCRGFRANIVGTPGADRLTATGGRDVIAALGGSDTIASLAGRDLICAGSGNDSVTAGPAGDRVFGGSGRDRLLGRGGADVLRGAGGPDLLKGNAGADKLRGERGIDRCRGGAGVDSIRGCER